MKVGDMVERCQKRNREMGQAMVEWALVFPVFLLLICAIMDFSWIGYQRLMFESSFQMTAWDFSLNLLTSGGNKLEDRDVLRGDTPPEYNTSVPDNVVKVNGRDYALGEGIKRHMLESAGGFLKEGELTVTSARAVFGIKSIEDPYRAGSETLYINSYQLRVDLEGDLEYRVKLLTPVSRAFIPSGEVVFTKKLVRERTERVVVERRVAVPASS